LIFLQRMVNEIIVAFLGPLHLTQQPLSRPITPMPESIRGDKHAQPTWSADPMSHAFVESLAASRV
jgi:hypothetical protein